MMRFSPKPVFAVVAVSALLCYAMPLQAAPSTGTVTQVFERPATASLRLGTQFFQPVREDKATSLPVTSVVVDETSDSEGAVTVPSPQGMETSQPAAAILTPVPVPKTPEQSDLTPAETAVSQSLPVRVDKTSTASQLQQLSRFERRNQIGEAWLLAEDLVRQNPDAEFAYDAAIRMGLILGRDADIERLYQEAIKRSRLPGKYYVQLAHYYQRKDKLDALQKLISDYAARNGSASDYRITLARLFAVAEDKEALLALFAKQGFTPQDIYPLLQLQLKNYIDTNMRDQATSIIATAASRDFGMAASRLLLLELLRMESPDPATIAETFQAAIANEPDYDAARGVADAVTARAAINRTLPALRDYLTSRSAQNALPDNQRWLLALLAERAGMKQDYISILTAEAAGNTPIIAFERAKALAESGRTAEAIPTLATLLSEQPDNVTIRLLLAGQLAKLNQSTNTLQLLQAARWADLSLEQQTRYAVLTVEALIANRDVPRLLDSWLELAPKSTFPTLQSMGDTVALTARDPEYRTLLTAAALKRVEADESAWPLYLILARLSALDSEPMAELEYYEKYLNKDRDNVPMLRFVAELALQHGSLQITLDVPGQGTNGDVKLRASRAGATAAAVQYYRRLIDLQPRIPENYSALMRAYQLRGEIETAKKVALEFADRASSTPRATAAAAAMLSENGFDDDALLYYRAAVTSDPEDFSAWRRYAATLRRVGKVGPASDILKRILEEGLHGAPFSQPEIFGSLLSMAEDSGSTAALTDYLNGLRSREIPGKPEFYVSLAKLHMQLGDPAEAEATLNEFLEQHKSSRYAPDALLLLGQLQYARRDLEAARATFLRVQDQHSTSPASITAAFNVAELQRQAGQVEQAIETWLGIARAHRESDKALAAIHTAALSAYGDLKDSVRAAELMDLFANSGSQDFALVNRARESADRLRKGQPPVPDTQPAS